MALQHLGALQILELQPSDLTEYNEALYKKIIKLRNQQDVNKKQKDTLKQLELVYRKIGIYQSLLDRLEDLYNLHNPDTTQQQQVFPDLPPEVHMRYS